MTPISPRSAHTNKETSQSNTETARSEDPGCGSDEDNPSGWPAQSRSLEVLDRSVIPHPPFSRLDQVWFGNAIVDSNESPSYERVRVQHYQIVSGQPPKLARRSRWSIGRYERRSRCQPVQDAGGFDVAPISNSPSGWQKSIGRPHRLAHCWYPWLLLSSETRALQHRA